MGGSGSSRGRGDPFSPWEDEAECGKLAFETTLEYIPDQPEHPRLTILEVYRQSTLSGVRFVAIDDDGAVIGRIAEYLAQLERCVSEGVAYVASVVSVNSGIYRVAVRPAHPHLAIGDYALEHRGKTGASAVKIMNQNQSYGDIVAGDNVLARHQICELRALVRAGAKFRGIPSELNSVTVEEVEEG